MISAHFIEFAALAAFLTGLAVVVWEIWAKDASLFRQIATDVRAMAEPKPVASYQGFTPAAPDFQEPANSNGVKLAA
jgi:hypothetical protein